MRTRISRGPKKEKSRVVRSARGNCYTEIQTTPASLSLLLTSIEAFSYFGHGVLNEPRMIYIKTTIFS